MRDLQCNEKWHALNQIEIISEKCHYHNQNWRRRFAKEIMNIQKERLQKLHIFSFWSINFFSAFLAIASHWWAETVAEKISQAIALFTGFTVHIRLQVFHEYSFVKRPMKYKHNYKINMIKRKIDFLLQKRSDKVIVYAFILNASHVISLYDKYNFFSVGKTVYDLKNALRISCTSRSV